ncbi:MAG: hypothetical protein E7179_03560 [Erysipelotrichaceae bacterium]|jgi:hypothetical protein|nr:hypothetical protein [Erysipelotrichaceae bacterium]
MPKPRNSRLSREDEQYGESESIQTQKSMLEYYARKNGFKDGAIMLTTGIQARISIGPISRGS